MFEECCSRQSSNPEQSPLWCSWVWWCCVLNISAQSKKCNEAWQQYAAGTPRVTLTVFRGKLGTAVHACVFATQWLRVCALTAASTLQKGKVRLKALQCQPSLVVEYPLFVSVTLRVFEHFGTVTEAHTICSPVSFSVLMSYSLYPHLSSPLAGCRCPFVPVFKKKKKKKCNLIY